MKGFHFFAVNPYKSKNKYGWTRKNIKSLVDSGFNIECVAVFSDRSMSYMSKGVLVRECIAGITYQPNSPVCCTGASQDWLHKCTTRISEDVARKAHPALFKYLDAPIKDY